MSKIPVLVFVAVVFSTLLASATRADESNESAVITSLQMRDKIILIKNQADGLKYSVKSEDGTLLSANLTEAELASKHPDLYEKVRPAVAFPNGSSFDGPWAGVHLPD